MGVWNKLKGQFIDVIDWTDETHDTIVWKFPRYDNEIKNGAQLIVRESQSAVLLHEGELGDVFGPGRHRLTTRNIPILTTLKSWKYAFDAPFKCDIFFVSKKQFTDLKWGTKNPIMLRDPEFGPVRLRAFGAYCVRVNDPGKFIRQIAGTGSLFETDEITSQFKHMLVSRFADVLGESKIPSLDLAANYNELGETLRELLQEEFNDYGVELTKFLIENISFPPEVENALDKRSQMGIIGDMSRYTQFQTANAITDMANNPGAGGNMMGVIAGVGVGNVVGGAMTSAGQSQGASPQAGGPPPLPPKVQWFAAVDGKQAGPFDQALFQQKIQRGEILRQTLVWRQGMEGWTPAEQADELSAAFKAMPPSMPG